MNAFSPIDFGVLVPGVPGLVSTGTSQVDAWDLTHKINVFSSVPLGTGAVLPSSFSTGSEISVMNRDGANSLLVYPSKGDQIENNAIDAPVAIVPGQNASFVSFDAPLARSPRTWYRSATEVNTGSYLPIAGGTLVGPGNLTTIGTFIPTGGIDLTKTITSLPTSVIGGQAHLSGVTFPASTRSIYSFPVLEDTATTGGLLQGLAVDMTTSGAAVRGSRAAIEGSVTAFNSASNSNAFFTGGNFSFTSNAPGYNSRGSSRV